MLAGIKSTLTGKGYTLYTRPYELNIVGVRAASTVPNRFDDTIYVFYKTGPVNWDCHVFKATTDPGTYWLKNPMMPQGTSILAQGQYRNAYQLGLHRGEYTALVQVGKVTVIRDYNRNAMLDFYNGSLHAGLFGINIHRASVNGITKSVDKYSAGCQVFENAGDFDRFINLCREHQKRYGNSFTYSLIDYRSIQKQTIKHIAVGTAIAGAAVAGYMYFSN